MIWIIWELIMYCVSGIVYPPNVCLIGDVQSDYNSIRDPRPLMGTYQRINETEFDFDPNIVNMTTPIYEHAYISNHSGDYGEQQYLFKIQETGWLIAETLPFENDSQISVFLTCYQESLLHCDSYRWYWGYNTFKFSIPSLQIMGDECSTTFCLKNLSVQLKPDNNDSSRLDGEFYQSFDPNTGEYEWINQQNTNLTWFNKGNSWVYSDDNIDFITCDPGYVDMPLFCTKFNYSQYTEYLADNNNKLAISPQNGGVTEWGLGLCNAEEPTMYPSPQPTAGPPKSCEYNGNTIYDGDQVSKQCEFGYHGVLDLGECLSNGEIGNWVQGCFQISFLDKFIDADLREEWTVYETEGVPGRSTLALDGSTSLEFIPDNAAYISVIKSAQQVTWPIRIRAVVERRVNECNLFAIGLGPEWAEREPYTSRIKWQCPGATTDSYEKMWSIYSDNFKLYDSTCWKESVTDTQWMEVVYTIGIIGDDCGAGRSFGVCASSVRTNISDCADLKVTGNEILSQNPWQNAYLWLGIWSSESSDWQSIETNETKIGRFESIGYTRFFTDFRGFRSVFQDDTLAANMKIGDKVSSNDVYYEFTIPFMVKLGIKKPWINGTFAQYISLGGTDYIQERTDKIVQIVWDSHNEIRLAYTGINIYYNGNENCLWSTNISNITFDVTIKVDIEYISITDELCDNVLTAKHDLETQQTVLTLGFIDDGIRGSGQYTQFTYAEVYQLPSSYAGNVVDTQNISHLFTSEPTANPTADPSTDPTADPSTDPTTSPTTKPTIAPLINSEAAEANKEYLLQLNNLDQLYQFVIITFVGVSVLILLFGIADAKKFRINDYFSFIAILTMIFQTNDMLSDVFFVLQVYFQNKIEMKMEYDLIFYAAIICIVVPSFTSLFQLYFHANKHWLHDNEHIRLWYIKYVTILLVLSIFTGSSFAAVALLNSQLFNIIIFDMGLSQTQLREFNTMRVYSVVMLENLPQLCFQTYFLLSSEGTDNIITMSSIIFSAISVIVTILSLATQRKIMHTQSYVVISMNVTGQCVIDSDSKCRTLWKELQMKFAILMGIDKGKIEIIKPTYIKNGVTLKINIYINDEQSKMIDYEGILIETQENSEISTIVKDSWQLSGHPVISEIEAKIVEAKEEKMENIEMMETTVNQS